LLPVITGGLIGVAGALGGARYGSRLTALREHKAERRAKLESLVTAAFELDVWFKREEQAHLWGGPDNFEPSPLATIETMALLYFPELEPQVNALSAAANQYRLWMLQGRQQRLQSNPQIVSKQHMNGLPGVYKPFINLRKELLERAKEVMSAFHAS
jgi:hypothetical protein